MIFCMNLYKQFRQAILKKGFIDITALAAGIYYKDSARPKKDE
jgi:hypothetical protein